MGKFFVNENNEAASMHANDDSDSDSDIIQFKNSICHLINRIRSGNALWYLSYSEHWMFALKLHMRRVSVICQMRRRPFENTFGYRYCNKSIIVIFTIVGIILQ